MSTEKWNIHILNLIFASLFFCVAFVTFLEPKLPNIVKQMFRYGKHYHKGVKIPIVSRLEVPKSWFSHFYIFATICSMSSLYLFIHVSVLHNAVPKCSEALLDFMGGGRKSRKVLMNTTSAFIALVLMSLQCWRRCYETIFVQIFSNKNKINLFIYFVAYLHYFAIMPVFLANTEGFVEGSQPSTIDLMQITSIEYFCIALFLFGWWHQYQSNLILVKLRKDIRADKVVTEEHFLPQGGFFGLISSPHMFFEVIMYVSLLGFMANNVTWWLIVLWVFANQVFVANFTHNWYLEHFKNYPTNRKAIIPFLL